MPRTPFDLSFEELTEAGAKASEAARQEAERAKSESEKPSSPEWVDPDDAQPWTADDFERAVHRRADPAADAGHPEAS